MRAPKPARLLIVDRDARYADWLRHHLGVLCPDDTVGVLTAEEFERASESLSQRECDLLLLVADFGASPEDPHAEGLELLRQLRSRSGFPGVLVIAEDGNELTAVRALQLGALDYLPKRLLTPERLNTSLRLALRRIERRMSRRLARLAQSAGAEATASEEQGDTADTPVVMGAALRDLIPGYAIRETIGQSEKAIVYLAASQALGRDVALKVSKEERDGSEDRQLLAREHAAISAIRHPAIVEIYDYGIHAGCEYLAMEYFAGGDLKTRLQLGISPTDALRYVEQIALALRVVHHAGILHRDLKPPNVMLRAGDDVVLIDFGLAKVDGGPRSTRIGVLRGSPYYMSPEQALGEELDARTDLYSLGVIFHEMLTGRKPYMGDSAMEVLEQHVEAPVPALPEVLADYQPLLKRLLAKSRSDRFASAEELIAAIAATHESSVRSSAA